MILDTNAVSALAEKDPRLIQKLGQARRVAVTLITLGEYAYGIRQSRARRELESWLRALLDRAQVLRPDLDTVNVYADVRTELRKAATPIPANDCWIAALARQHRLPLLSRDRHFDRVPKLRRIEW